MKDNQGPTGQRFAVGLAVVAVLISLAAFLSKKPHAGVAGPLAPAGLVERINTSSELHAGYGVYPPYTQEDPNTKRVSGFSVEIIEQIAKELKCKVVWHRLNWNTMSADLKRGEYDVIADPIFQTIPRAREFAFTEPYAYFPDGIAVVRKGEDRFTGFDSLDRQSITIAVGQGWASETLVKARFTKAKIVTVQTATDLLQLFNEVVAGRADVAVADGADAARFVKEHPDAVKALWMDSPPAAMPAGFALRPSDANGAEFLTVCLRNLKSTGVLDALAHKYEIQSAKSKTE
jgi:ABC-type amino acid transport substrate-binding protein